MFGFSLEAVFWAASVGILVLIAIIDASTSRIPDALNVLLIVSALAYRLLEGDLFFSGASLIVLFLGVQWAMSRGRWMGSGDVFLGVGAGLFLGSWREALLCLLLAYALGAIMVLILSAKKFRSGHTPFGPFLVAGCLLTALFPSQLFPLFPFLR